MQGCGERGEGWLGEEASSVFSRATSLCLVVLVIKRGYEGNLKCNFTYFGANISYKMLKFVSFWSRWHLDHLLLHRQHSVKGCGCRLPVLPSPAPALSLPPPQGTLVKTSLCFLPTLSHSGVYPSAPGSTSVASELHF